MKRLRANVRRVTGSTAHTVQTANGVERLPDPVAVEIAAEDSAFFLYRLDGKGECIADTWHQTVDEAKAQANHEYGIEEEDWKTV